MKKMKKEEEKKKKKKEKKQEKEENDELSHERGTSWLHGHDEQLAIA